MAKHLRVIAGHDADVAASELDVAVALWDRATDTTPHLSLARAVDERFDELQARFVEWRDALAATGVAGRPLASRLGLKVSGGGALWWATTIASTPIETLDRVADILKLLVLEEIVAHGQFTTLRYEGSDAAVSQVLQAFAAARQMAFDSTARTRTKEPSHAIQAARYFTSFLKRRAKLARRRARRDRFDLAVVTYFPNIVDEAAKRGVFESRYWGPLHRLTDRLGLKVRWIWFYSDHGEMSADDAVQFRDALNASGPTHSYEFLEEASSIWTILASLWRFGRLVWIGQRARGLASRFVCRGSTINFFPLLEDQWRSSFHGSHAMFMALYAGVFSDAFSRAPAGRLLYVWENQSWEYLLLDAWKRACGGQAIAVAHTANCSSPMLLRNRIGANQLRSLSAIGPDRLVAIGAQAAAAFRDFGWPAAMVVQAEALRYSHLAGAYQAEAKKVPSSGRRLLVLTGISRHESESVLRLLVDAAALGALRQYAHISFKAHPFAAIDDLVSDLSLDVPHSTVVDQPLHDLLRRHDVVLSSCGTSASTEVGWFGVPQVLVGGVAGLNVSPLRVLPTVRFAVTATELARQLDSPQATPMESTFFQLDPDLPAWRALLNDSRNVA